MKLRTIDGQEYDDDPYYPPVTMTTELVDRLRDKAHCNDWYLRQEAAKEIERLRERDDEHEQRYSALEAMVDHLRSRIERLRAVILDSICPGGGYTGQTDEPIVANCLKAGKCGCDTGAAVRGDEAKARDQ